MVEKLPDHIKEYLDTSQNKSDFLDLFQSGEEDIDLRTDVSYQELVLVNKVFFNSEYLQKKGIPDCYGQFIDRYLRLKVSMDRKSRQEFVSINKSEHFEDNLNKFNSFTNLQKVKQ